MPTPGGASWGRRGCPPPGFVLGIVLRAGDSFELVSLRLPVCVCVCRSVE